MSPPNQTTIPKNELILAIREVLPEIQPAMPRFDWKWFLSLALPLVVPFIAAGVIGYFSIKADLKIIQRDVRHTQTAVTEVKRKIDDIEKQMQRLEIGLVKVEGRLVALEQKVDTLDKRVEKLEKK